MGGRSLPLARFDRLIHGLPNSEEIGIQEESKLIAALFIGMLSGGCSYHQAFKKFIEVFPTALLARELKPIVIAKEWNPSMDEVCEKLSTLELSPKLKEFSKVIQFCTSIGADSRDLLEEIILRQ